LSSVAGLLDHLEVRFPVQQESETVSNGLVIFNQQYADGPAHGISLAGSPGPSRRSARL
jgi:hypothetical protein